MGVYSVDLELLDTQITRMAAFERTIETRLADLEREIEALHTTWTGLAATAQARAHEEWQRGAREMHQALADLRAAARVAHTNYTHAAHTNTSMWSRVG